MNERSGVVARRYVATGAKLNKTSRRIERGFHELVSTIAVAFFGLFFLARVT